MSNRKAVINSRSIKVPKRMPGSDTQRKGPEQKTESGQKSVKFMLARAFRSWKLLLLSAAALAVAFFVDKRTFRIVTSLRRYNVEPQAPAFEVVDLPGKGKGLIASRDIKQGELLIREPPLILVPSSTTISPVEVIKDRLGLLSETERDEFYALSFVSPGKVLDHIDPRSNEVALAIFQTNAIAAGENAGLFLKTARMNHGCSSAFNSVYSWRPQEEVLVVHALKSIKRGQELLTTYTDTKKSRYDRQQYLKVNYDFTCTCPVCSFPEVDIAASDERLTKMTLLGQIFKSWGTGAISGAEASRIAKEIWALGDEEGYWSERGRLAADMVYVAAAHFDEKAVASWAKLAHTWYAIELGRNSTQALEMEILFNQPSSHFAWATRQPQPIGLPDSSD